MSWDTVPAEIVKTTSADKITEQNISAQTSISFNAVDYPDQSRIKLAYSINNAQRKFQFYNHKKHGIEATKER